MKLFACPNCGQIVFFGNIKCERCDSQLGYDHEINRMRVLAPEYKYCGNYAQAVCNWLLPSESPDTLCRACRHNLTIPNLADPQNVDRWRKIEEAKHRLLYTVLRLKLPLFDRTERPDGLGFEFVDKAMTGHNHGLITIAVAEADDPEREKRRTELGEPYRTLLGHFRHEIGHWYWDVLVAPDQSQFTQLFGDANLDYGEALKAHYANGPKPSWQDSFVSAYAGSHPWEDFAETWAHYFHMVDTLDTGGSFGIVLSPKLDRDHILSTSLDFDVYDPAITIETIHDAWVALSSALNSFNRSMGLADPYPFVLSPKVVEKLGYIHSLVRRH
ncbi:MAG: putative zinc-binding metallopeptidase [Kofleriaceae bacterium]